MNCKQGDLALILWGPSQGQAVTCLEALPAGFLRDDLPRGIRQQIHEQAGPLWRVDRLIEWGESPESRRYRFSTSLRIAPDRALMPISPDSPVKEREKQQTSEAC